MNEVRHSIFRKQKAAYFAIVIGIIVVLGFALKEEIGKTVWTVSHTPMLALVFNYDAMQALEIGNYYFNAYGDGVYDLAKAQKYFYVALDIDPEVPDAWHQLARIDFLNGDFEDALQKINTQIAVHGDTFMASYYIRGLIYGYMKLYDEAEKDFLTFLTWDTRNWAAYNDLAWVYFSRGNYERSLWAAKQGYAVDPDNALVLNMYGLSLMNLGRGEEAIPFLEKALAEAKKLSEADWHKAYPGNDPSVAKTGLEEVVKSITYNLDLAVSN